MSEGSGRGAALDWDSESRKWGLWGWLSLVQTHRLGESQSGRLGGSVAHLDANRPATEIGRRADLLWPVTRGVVALALALATLGTYAERWGLQGVGPGTQGASVRVGALAPSFTARRLTGGVASLEEFRDRVVVLNFWATWCPPCRVEMPELQAYQAEMGDRVVILGIDLGEPSEVVDAFVRQYGLTFPMLLDESGAIAATYGVTGLPTSIILDRSGTVRERVVGAMTRDALGRRVERLL